MTPARAPARAPPPRPFASSPRQPPRGRLPAEVRPARAAPATRRPRRPARGAAAAAAATARTGRAPAAAAAIASSRHSSASSWRRSRVYARDEPGEVAARRLVPRAPLRVPPLDVGEQQPERPHVLLVVDHDAGERVDRPAAQHVEVDRRDLPALDVADAADAQQLALDGAQPRVVHPVLEHAPDERQQVEVPGVDRRGSARQPVARLDQRPVEARARCRSRARCRA